MKNSCALTIDGRPLGEILAAKQATQSVRSDIQPLNHWLPPKQLAQALDTSQRSLERMRSDGTGPPFAKVGRKILYRLDDVEDWLEGRTFGSTAEARRAGSR